uniref:Ribonuclease H-like domain-containing protein n=1 Tax=Tanacetum cinerariifolium TaxID=118510 RepID=A0A6L2NE57_TANCI|nr:ribonuclease H-like domain-containing protein [Tanacetum cinerariifolium]
MLYSSHQMVFNSPCLTHKKELIHHEGTALTHTLIWRNKIDLEDKSLDDLFNSLKIYESEVKHSSSQGSNSQNLAFVSTPYADSTNDSVSVSTVSFYC